MIDGLISGKLYGKATRRIGKNERQFTTAKARAAVANDEAIFVNLITFSDSIGAALMALSDGDTISASGTIRPTVWIDSSGAAKVGLDMTINVLQTLYTVAKKRKAVQGKSAEPAPAAPGEQMPYDEIP